MKFPLHSGKTSAVPSLLNGRRLRLSRLAASAFFGGTAEALFLVLLTRMAFAVTDEADVVTLFFGRSTSVHTVALLCVALVAFRVVLAVDSTIQLARLSSDAVAKVRSQLAKAFLSASWPAQQAGEAGSLQELLTTYSNKAAGSVTASAQLIVALANLAALFGLALVVAPLGALGLILLVVVFGLVLHPLRAAIRRRAARLRNAGMTFATSVSEVSELGLESHVFGVHDALAERIEAEIFRSRRLSERLATAQGIVSPLYNAMAFLGILAALWLSALINPGNLESLGAAVLMMLRSLSYGLAAQTSQATLIAAGPSVEALYEQIDRFSSARRPTGSIPLERVAQLSFRNVSFSYHEGAPVLHDVNLDLGPSEIVGIIGPSGGGKSTLLQLLLGVRDPDSGIVEVDGVDLRQVARSDWNRLITFVPQESHLLRGTIGENIAFFRESVSNEDIERAARQAHIHDTIAKMAHSYQQRIGGPEGNLSGGQAQRICIARALVERPDFLVLDEPTSALDAPSEHLFRTTLEQLGHSMTVVVVAHRLSTLEVCDRIVVVEDGRIVACDTPQKLRGSSEFFRTALAASGLT